MKYRTIKYADWVRRLVNEPHRKMLTFRSWYWLMICNEMVITSSSSRTISRWQKQQKSINLLARSVHHRPFSSAYQPKQKGSMHLNCAALVEGFELLRCSMQSVVETNTMSKQKSLGWWIRFSLVDLLNRQNQYYRPMEQRRSICSVNCIA